jgi:hypothetical protein
MWLGQDHHVAVGIGEVGGLITPIPQRAWTEFASPSRFHMRDGGAQIVHKQVEFCAGYFLTRWLDWRLSGVPSEASVGVKSQAHGAREGELRIDGFINRLGPPEGSMIEVDGPLQFLDRKDHESQSYLFRHTRLLTLRRKRTALGRRDVDVKRSGERGRLAIATTRRKAA